MRGSRGAEGGRGTEEDRIFESLRGNETMSHQCCLLDSSQCSRPDSRNAARARSPPACTAAVRLPAPQSGRLSRGTTERLGPEEPSPARPAGTAPRGALRAECRRGKCRWFCCNICVETKRGGRVFQKVSIGCRALTALGGATFTFPLLNLSHFLYNQKQCVQWVLCSHRCRKDVLV